MPAGVAVGLSGGAAGCASSPSIFRTAGPEAESIARLGWLFTIVAVAVTLIVAGVLIAALYRPRSDRTAAVKPANDHEGAARWIVVGGVALPSVILVVCFVCTLLTQSAISRPPAPVEIYVRVIAHRWWWEMRYAGAGPDQAVVTANELHVPAGRPVRIELISNDVIHSFWVPALAGKTDVIPGQNNSMWLEADRPGTYVGECAEYCGVQHAHMGFVVVADEPSDYAAWLARQRSSAPTPSDLVGAAGLAVFHRSACVTCHAIRGTGMDARVGPDLSHLASRQALAAGTLPNTRGNLAGWVVNAQRLKPGSRMPDVPLGGRDLQALIAYLETLR
jgi:cytochrome c oxidase subunit 2